MPLAHFAKYVEKAVASFFTPASKKTLELVEWRTIDGSLLVGRYKGQGSSLERRKIAAFDFVSLSFSSFYTLSI